MAAAKRKYKTVKKVTTGSRLFRKWDDWKEGDIIVGKYEKMYIDDTYESKNYVIKVEESTFKLSGKSIVGQALVLNSMGMLDKAMEDVKEGKLIQFEYTGKGKLKTGKYKGKPAHSCTVEIVKLDDGTEDDMDEEEEEDEDIDMDEDEDLDEEEEDDL